MLIQPFRIHIVVREHEVIGKKDLVRSGTIRSLSMLNPILGNLIERSSFEAFIFKRYYPKILTCPQQIKTST